MQTMLNIVSRYAKEHHYLIHPVKTQLVDCSKTPSNYDWVMNDNKLKITNQSEHLGVIRADKKETKANIETNIQTARRTKYALMGSGFHGTNGLHPQISYKIYKTYVIPKLIYGLEILPLNKENMEQLEVFHRKCLRHIQSLPDRTSNSAVLLLLGALPIEAEIHKRQLSLLYSTLSCNNERIKEVMDRQICTNYDNKQSFFCKVLELIQMYDMPSIQALKNSLPKKVHWKREVNNKINNFWTQKLVEEASSKSSLKYLNIKNLEIGKSSNVWNLHLEPRLETRKAIVKARMVTGSYILEIDKHKFNNNSIDPT
jgi:hypothetical protein